MVKKSENYTLLITTIGTVLSQARLNAYRAANTILVQTYWQIGKYIVEFEQQGNEKAEYGSKLLDTLSKDLMKQYGKGFSRSNLISIRLLYLKYPISQTLSDQLTWSHYVTLLTVTGDFARGFYEKQCLLENWSVRELKRQKDTHLFERLALSKDKKGILVLSEKDQLLEKSSDLIRDPYILEFLQIPENYKLTEKELEQKLIENLKMFLLELGKGFAFIGRQYRITLDNTHFHVDLVFYHRILKCFVLIDLKIEKVDHLDVDQMNMYLNYFKKEEMEESDNPPIGIILGADKNDSLVEYALGGITSNMFISKYQLYLPKIEELRHEIEKVILIE